jgi:hypothetical protein
MATEAAWLTGNRLTERRKKKCALTSIGLLMEGLENYFRVARHPRRTAGGVAALADAPVTPYK